MTTTITPQQARDAGIARTLNAHGDDSEQVRKAILRWIRENPEAKVMTANDIRPLLTGLSIHGPVMGGVFSTFVRKHCRLSGLETSTDVGTHAKRIGKWRITAKARKLAGDTGATFQ